MADPEPQVTEPVVEPEPQTQEPQTEPQHEKVVSYERFSEINTKAKQAEDRVRELEAQLASNQAPPAVDPFAQPQYQQPYQAPAPIVEIDPYDSEAKKLGYQSWNQWAQYDMNGAMKGRQNVENTQRSMQELNQTQQRFAQEWFKEKPDLIDANKRRSDPEFLEFSRIITENPYYRISEKGLKDAKELAQLRVSQRTKSQETDRIRQEGQKQEQDRMAQANMASAPVGSGSVKPLGVQSPTIKLSPAEEKVRARMGVSAEEYRKSQEQINAQSGSTNKKYVATNYAKPQRPSLAGQQKV